MHKVLLFDDRSQGRLYLKELIESHNMKVFSCRSIYEAREIWEEKRNELDAIVLDMMMPSLGLNNILRKQTNAGVLSGWIWLWYDLNPENIVPHPASDKCIIIYSAYLKDFEEYINSNKSINAEKEFAERVKRIPKGYIHDKNDNEIVKLLLHELNRKKGA
jgi:hypothetical protein